MQIEPEKQLDGSVEEKNCVSPECMKDQFPTMQAHDKHPDDMDDCPRQILLEHDRMPGPVRTWRRVHSTAPLLPPRAVVYYTRGHKPHDQHCSVRHTERPGCRDVVIQPSQSQ